MRILKSLTIAALIFAFFPFTSSAQIRNDNVFDDLPEHLLYQVKQLDQFIARFNSNENAEGIRINATQASQEDREKILASLFDLEMLNQPDFKAKAIRFIDEVAGSKIQNLSFYDNNFFATINCKVLYKNKREQLTLTLVVEGNPSNGSHWGIKGARANFLEETKQHKSKANIIPPTNHEVEFIALLDIFNEKKDLNNYISGGNSTNQLNQLNEVLKSGNLKMLSTSPPTYHFLQVPGWLFTVDYFNRSSNNSGLLISDLQRAGQPEINKYKTEKLFILQ